MEDEFVIKVLEITKNPTPEGRTSDDGTGADSIRAAIIDNWDKYKKIVISFEGIAKMSRVFMDEAFAKILEHHTLHEINAKVFFPDAKEHIVKDLNSAIKLRRKIVEAQKAREEI